jgi:dihydrofolate synthase/folylpolyglutamate synthase
MQAPRTFLASLELIGIKLGLDQIRGLVASLEHPERTYRSIAIAGTNGKGSVTAMLERGLRASGYRTGRYTSPHLVHLEERFTLDGVDVAPGALDTALTRVQQASASLPAPPSFFEATTAAALDLFRTSAVDVALLEVGLGGRLDATNVVDTVASVLTSIDFDHQQFLGDTIEAIAWEKAGVIKPGTFCVLAANRPAVQAVVARRCGEVGAELVDAATDLALSVTMHEGRARIDLRTPVRRYEQLTLGLRGRHQVQNAVTAIRALEELDRRGVFRVAEAAVRTAVEDVIWPGRLELVTVDSHAVLIDGAHNAAGAAALAAFLRETWPRPLPIVLGVLRDKDVFAVVSPLAGVASRIVCTAAPSPRAMAPADLAAVVRGLGPGVEVDACDDPRRAIAIAAEHGSPVVVAGSLYLAGEVRSNIS